VITAEKNRLGATDSRAVERPVEAHVRWLEKELSPTDRDFEETIRKSPT
jgi:hypothetical protein